MHNHRHKSMGIHRMNDKNINSYNEWSQFPSMRMNLSHCIDFKCSESSSGQQHTLYLSLVGTAPSTYIYFTVNPSARRQTLCASIRSAQCSSPCCTTHSSRSFLVSGHEQQIFFPDFPRAGFFFSGSAGTAGTDTGSCEQNNQHW